MNQMMVRCPNAAACAEVLPRKLMEEHVKFRLAGYTLVFMRYISTLVFHALHLYVVVLFIIFT